MGKTGGWKELAAAAVLACSFWNIVYPEFALTGDAYRKEASSEGGEENGSGEPGTRERQNRTDYYEILNASEGEVEIRFSFLEDRVSECTGMAQGKTTRRQIERKIEN